MLQLLCQGSHRGGLQESNSLLSLQGGETYFRSLQKNRQAPPRHGRCSSQTYGKLCCPARGALLIRRLTTRLKTPLIVRDVLRPLSPTGLHLRLQSFLQRLFRLLPKCALARGAEGVSFHRSLETSTTSSLLGTLFIVQTKKPASSRSLRQCGTWRDAYSAQ